MTVYFVLTFIVIGSVFYIFYIFNTLNDLSAQAKGVFNQYVIAAHARYSIVPNLIELLRRSNNYDNKQLDQLLHVRNDAITLLDKAAQQPVNNIDIEQIEKFERIFDWRLNELEHTIIQDNSVYRVNQLDMLLTDLRRTRLTLINELDQYKIEIKRRDVFQHHPIVLLLTPVFKIKFLAP